MAMRTRRFWPAVIVRASAPRRAVSGWRCCATATAGKRLRLMPRAASSLIRRSPRRRRKRRPPRPRWRPRANPMGSSAATEATPMRLTTPNDGRLRRHALRWLPPVVLVLSLVHASWANSSGPLVLEAGASTTIDGVDSWCTPQVRYVPGPMPFYVQATEPTKLLILAVARGAGEVTITRNDVPFTYRIV